MIPTLSCMTLRSVHEKQKDRDVKQVFPNIYTFFSIIQMLEKLGIVNVISVILTV